MTDTGQSPLRHRSDIQGLRALAVTSVVLYHAGVPRLNGGFVGVDLFFVISGFLITSLLLAEWERSARISLAGFWARRARRILPASTLVLAVTAVASAVVVPALQRPAVSRDMLWASFFSANWRFADQSTDYLAQQRAVSPVLHYWTLGVEEQFYLGWPLIVAAVIFVGVRRSRGRGSVRLLLGAVTAAIVLASFAYGVHETAANQPYAFFGTPSRAWQLGVGCLLAVATPVLVRTGRIVANALAVTGVLGFAWAMVSLQEAGGVHPYPGWQALVPTAAGAFLISAGIGATPTTVGRVLSLKPLQALGDLSYSWYLWHFPILILGGLHYGTDSPLVTTGLVALSLIAAWVSFTYVETPLRGLPALVRRPGRSLAFGGALVATAVLAATVMPQLGQPPARTVVALDGSRIVLRPSPQAALSDYISMRSAGCDLDFEETEMPECDFADTSSDKQVVLLGDSHAVVLFPPLERAAERLEWRLNNWTKSACPVADVTVFSQSRQRKFTECDEFRSAILDRVVAERPDVVLVSASVNHHRQVFDRADDQLLSAAESRPAIVDGLRSVLSRLTDAGIRVILTVDPPAAPFDPPTCLAEEADVASCGFRKSRLAGPEREAASGLDGVTLFNFTPDICRDRACSPVKGRILVYRDTNHVTKTFALTLTRRLEHLLAG